MSALTEDGLLERIKDFGADVYAGNFATLRDRMATTIAHHRIETVIAGRGPDGKAETFGQAFKRIYGTAARVIAGNEGKPAPGRTWKGKAP